MWRRVRRWWRARQRQTHPIPGYSDSRYTPPHPEFRYLWWVITSDHPCDDCKRLAAGSPYTAPFGDNPMPATCGDGYTSCGGDCSCKLSYTAP